MANFPKIEGRIRDMSAFRQVITVSLISVFFAASCAGQSLADAARRQQALKKPDAAQPHRVITNDDLASGSKADDSNKAPEKKVATAPASGSEPAQDPNHPSAEEIKAGVKAQRQRIAQLGEQVNELQKKLDTWKNSDCTHVMHSDNRNACDVLGRLNAELDITKSQLESEKKNLEWMQEDARKMGYPNSVYDPN
jgi:hypothetical protein